MGMRDPSGGLTGAQKVAAVALAGALIGGVLSPVAFGTVSEPTSTVVILEVEGPIESTLADDVETQLSDIRQNDSVGAVVLKMDTPGGAAPASERMYTAVQRTAEEMPVIASVQGASASGGYYTMLPADQIYVLPTSITGSVGLAASAPQETAPVRGPSGPNKRGENTIQQWATQQTLADTFINTVMQQRGDEIALDREQVATAAVFLGVEAVQNGFADEIGSTDDAIRAAAQQAGLDEYRTETRETGLDGFPILIQTSEGIVAVYANDPGYGQVEPLGNAFVHQGSVPHVDTVERFTTTEVAPVGGSVADGSGDNSADDDEDDDDQSTLRPPTVEVMSR